MRHTRLDIAHETRKRFVKEVVARLSTAKAQGKFDRLVLVASKQLIGELRQQLGKTAETVTAEVPKDLAHAPIGALSLYLAQRRLI